VPGLSALVGGALTWTFAAVEQAASVTTPTATDKREDPRMRRKG
jgi:hypothetical protein